jgi:HlyD family secretion protein
MAGVIKKLGTDPNDASKMIDYNSRVKKGTILAELDKSTLEPAAAKAKAELNLAQAEVDLARAQLAKAEGERGRNQKRAANDSADDAESELAKAALAVARAKVRTQEAALELRRAELEIANANLDNCSIRSPIDGTVLDRRFKVGQLVAPTPFEPSLFLIADPRFQVWCSVR